MSVNPVVAEGQAAYDAGRSMYHAWLNLTPHLGPQPKLATVNLPVYDVTEVLSALYDMGWDLVAMSTHKHPQWEALAACYAFRRR